MNKRKPLLGICHTCLAQRNCQAIGGVALCPEDGANIQQHAQERWCPIGKYRLGPGDVLAFVLYAAGIAQLWKRTVGRWCTGCKWRQLWMNRMWQKIKRARAARISG